DGDVLLRDVKRLAVAVLLARHWPREGGRHDVRLTIGGFLARAGIKGDAVAAMVKAKATADKGKEGGGSGQASGAAVERHAGGSGTRGMPSRMEAFDEKVATRAAKWLDYQTQDERPAKATSEQAPEFSEECIALLFANQHCERLRYVAKWGMWLVWDG